MTLVIVERVVVVVTLADVPLRPGAGHVKQVDRRGRVALSVDHLEIFF